jgi:acetyl-CoA carboxylase biotin carboxyl carrier protein
MEGSFWGSPQPGAKPYFSPGSPVQSGDTVGLVEVMKTFTPIRAAADGVWLGPAVADGAGIVAGEAVGWIRPD